VLIGAPNHDTKGDTEVGVAYLFNTRGDLVNTFTNPSPATGDFFGFAVAGVGPSRVAIAAPFDDTGAEMPGVYLYASNAMSHSWVRTTLTNPAPEANDYFGRVVTGWGPTGC